MKLLNDYFGQNRFMVADTFYTPSENLASFADTNALLQYCDQFNQPIIHFWTLTNTIILGMMDVKLPHFADAVSTLKQAGYHYFVRNSGGLAVASDVGILNVSLFLPNFRTVSIDAAYQQMVDWVKAAYDTEDLPIEVREITRSYCPGTFDLSIYGQKFGGISQRRVHNGVAVMLYLSVTGDQDRRSQTLRDFYIAGLQGQTSKWHFPDVDPKVMANMDTLLSRDLQVEGVKAELLQVMSQAQLLDQTLAFQTIQTEPEYQAFYQNALRNLEQRNQKDLAHKFS
ncbi:lipoate--protein ligase family protein [Agrilactobacillus fermenti]|uniref:lipoate--protein ligase family protein n=1 Tax=Agrilactobacillus fermenti TaxID=2586909 RepID=UPI003A5C1543